MNFYADQQKSAYKASSPFHPLVSIVTVVLERPAPLAETIKSVQHQTYPEIEHIVIDGGSEDSTLDVIRGAEQSLAFWSSEPDEGIYDAINKGIQRATGQYVLILHAGDTYEPDYVDRLVDAGRKDPSAVVFSNYHHGATPVECTVPTSGIYFHHLGLNHSAFLIPKTVYDTIGLYDPKLRIVSDAIWMRRAFENKIDFVRADGFGLRFAKGGLSSAQSEAHRELVISEWVESYRRFFPFLSESAASSIYLYRFAEAKSQEIVDYLELVFADSFGEKPDFLEGISKAIIHIWGLRRLDAADAQGVKNRRRLCEFLQIDPRHSNIYAGDEPISFWLDAIEDLKNRCGDRPVTLHYLEMFSRRSETFIPDLITRMAEHDKAAHVILCDKRTLAKDRPYNCLFHFDYPAYPEAFATWVTESLIDALSPKGFLFHFTINGWRLLSRLAPRYQRIPAIYMSHGIDAYALFQDSLYSKFVLNVISELPMAKFTAVSEHLGQALIRAGIPEAKVHIVHNVAHGRFFKNRMPGHAKRADRANIGFAARIISIGRLIRWKGQDDLIRAIGILRKDGIEVHATIVYGGENRDQSYLNGVIEEEGVTDLIEFREKVNFDEEPDFFNKFDMLVSASKYTSGIAARSDTFGMSILEGIAAGLPIVATDAGGQPEVAGPPNQYVRVARHDEPESLAAEIRTLIENGALDGDNHDIAKERVEHFSAERQLDLLAEITDETRQKRINPLLISTALDKGAGGAAQNVHRALLKSGVSSKLAFRHQVSNWKNIPSVECLNGSPGVMGDHIQPNGWFLRSGYTIFSVDTDGIRQADLVQLVADCDVINLHWYARFLSNSNITYLTRSEKPVIFTIRDMHPLTGGCHFFHNCENWRTDCFPCPQFRPEHTPLPRDTLLKKRSEWDLDNVTIVTLSDHTRSIIEQSPLFGKCRIEKISNPIDHRTFRPTDKAKAREQFGIPLGKKVVAYLPSFNSTVKGAREFQLVMERIAKEASGADLIILCAGRRRIELDCAFEVIQAGFLQEKSDLAAFYNAADVTVVPSLEETFSNTTAESIACGTPVAGFRTGAIAELATEGRGMSAPVGDIPALAVAITSILEGDSNTDAQRKANHTYMAKHYAPEVIGNKYKSLYADLINNNTRRPVELPDSPQINNYPKYLAARLAYAEREKVGLSRQSQELKLDLQKQKQRLQEQRNDFLKLKRSAQKLKQQVEAHKAEALAAYYALAHKNGQLNAIDTFDENWIKKNSSFVESIVSRFTQRTRSVLFRNTGNFGAMDIPSYGAMGISRDIPIPDNFDEKAYLSLFPDVQQSVASNKLPSGYYHYLRYGRFEGRIRPGGK